MPPRPSVDSLERRSTDGFRQPELEDDCVDECHLSKLRGSMQRQCDLRENTLPLLVSVAADVGLHHRQHEDEENLSVSSSVDCSAKRSLGGLTPRSASPTKTNSRAPPTLFEGSRAADINSPYGVPSDSFLTKMANSSIASAASLDAPVGRQASPAKRANGQLQQSETSAKSLFITGLLLVLWYSFSTILSLYNKWLFGQNFYGFDFPLFVTGVHMLVQFSVACSILGLRPDLRPNRRPRTWDYCTKVLPCGLATGFDVGLSNCSMKTITLAFYTMCKSSSLIWILLFAFLFRLERPTARLIGVILVIFVGVFMMVMDETTFVLIGFIEVMSAAVLGGLRWSLTQMLLDRESYGMNNPVAAMFFLTPLMAGSLLTASEIVEGFNNMYRSPFFATRIDATRTLFYSAAGGFIASAMILSEFCLISRTSVVSLSIGGIVKEVATILTSSIAYGDRLSLVNMLGLTVAAFGIGLYNYMKLADMRAAAAAGAFPITAAAAGDEYARLAMSESGIIMEDVVDAVVNEHSGSGLVVFDEADEVVDLEDAELLR